MQEVPKKLGKRITELRRKKGFSQEGFAHECGFHRSHMGAVDAARKTLRLLW
jgi:transcriptional regulator with XRE-family HTH domain